jgi:acyl-CoA hydrolase
MSAAFDAPLLEQVPDLSTLLRPGDRVVCGQVAAEPLTLTRALVAQRERLPDIEVFVGSLFSDTFGPSLAAHWRFRSYGAMGRLAPLAATGALRIVPSHYGELESAFESGALRADVVLLQIVPGRDGEPPSFGLAHDYVVAAARQARLVIAEVNDQVPWTFGAEVPADFRIDLMVRATQAPLEVPAAAPGEIEARIAAHIAERVPDGATLQTGIGVQPDAVLAGLAGHRDLGLHTGLMGDRAIELIERGVINNARKSIDAGVSITNLVGGSRRGWAHLDRNPALRVVPARYTHDAGVLARIDSLYAINSGLEVDLGGQVNAEMVAGKPRGGVGGLNDFVRGARHSSGGRSIIALPSTTADGRISRIVPGLGSGIATVARSDADWVVTEWGVAELRHQDLDERARRLIAIAAPKFRDALTRALKEPGSWTGVGS